MRPRPLKRSEYERLVASGALEDERVELLPLYAASGYREYWIVNVAEKTVEVHRGPRGDRYADVTRHAQGEVLRIEAFPDVEVEVAAVFA
jgi:Uma2 family endonuclease